MGIGEVLGDEVIYMVITSSKSQDLPKRGSVKSVRRALGNQPWARVP